MKTKFEIGQRVTYCGSASPIIRVNPGQIGTILGITDHIGCNILVQFDEPVRGQIAAWCGFKGKLGYCCWCGRWSIKQLEFKDVIKNTIQTKEKKEKESEICR